MPAESSRPPKIRVFIVDDHPCVREGIAACIRDQPDMMLCGQAGTIPEALEGVARTRPTVVVVDIEIPGRDGLELIKELKARYPRLPLLVLSMHDESLYAPRALHAGAAGYVMKSAPTETLLQAIRQVCAGKVVVSEAVQTRLLRLITSGGKPSALGRLTDRELEVLRLYGQGRTRGQIAAQLNLSVKTVETHRAHICRKLGLRNSTELLRFAMDFVRHPTTGPTA